MIPANVHEIRRRLCLIPLICIIPCKAFSASYGSGTYDSSLSATGETTTISGDIVIDYKNVSGIRSALIASDNGQLNGNLDNLSIHLLSPYTSGITVMSGGTVMLNGPVSIATVGNLVGNYGIHAAVGSEQYWLGSLKVDISADGGFGVSAAPGHLVLHDTLSVNYQGDYGYGLFVGSMGTDPGIVDLYENTDIQVSGEGSAAICLSGGTVNVKSGLNILAQQGANAIQMDPVTPGLSANNNITTRTTPNLQSPSPQTILLQGKVELINPDDSLFLDLGQGSEINSLFNINKGSINLQFYSPKASLLVVPGSIIGSGGSLKVTFVEGGVVQFPLAAENMVSDGVVPTPPLLIQTGGQLNISGPGAILGDLQIAPPYEGQKFLLVQQQGTASPMSIHVGDPSTSSPEHAMVLSMESDDNNTYLIAHVSTSAPEKPVPPVPETPLIPDPSKPVQPDPPDPSKPVQPDPDPHKPVKVAVSSEQWLPVYMVDQQLAYQLAATARTPFCQEGQHSRWFGECSDRLDEPFSVWMLPVYEHVRAKNLESSSGDVGMHGNLRGIGAQLVNQREQGQWGAGIYVGNGSINSANSYPPAQSHVDYLGGIVHGAARLGGAMVNAGFTYLHGRHRLQQYSNNLYFFHSDLKVDLAGVQLGASWPLRWQGWGVNTAIEFWDALQPAGNLSTGSADTYHRSKGRQRYWQLPVGLSVRGGKPLANRQRQIHVSPELDIRWIPAWGDRQLNTELSSLQSSANAVTIASPLMDRSSVELSASVLVNSSCLQSKIQYSARRSSHILTQQVSVDFVFQF